LERLFGGLKGKRFNFVEFKLEGLHERYVTATCDLDAICLKTDENKKNKKSVMAGCRTSGS
jgi:hypothetical protein